MSCASQRPSWRGSGIHWTRSAPRESHSFACARPTFWEQAAIAVRHVPAEKPAVAEVIVALDQLDAVALGQAQLVDAAGHEIVDDEQNAARVGLGLVAISVGHGESGALLHRLAGRITCDGRPSAGQPRRRLAPLPLPHYPR